MQKTNVMRILEQHKVTYTAHSYPHSDAPADGKTVAALIGKDPAQVYKTLVARGASRSCYVFVIPVMKELDLKKAASAAGEKSVAMLHLSELTPTTGYVRGGCSPIGMKKQFPTFIDSSALMLENMLVSAGKIGFQIEVSPRELQSLVSSEFCDLCVEE